MRVAWKTGMAEMDSVTKKQNAAVGRLAREVESEMSGPPLQNPRQSPDVWARNLISAPDHCRAENGETQLVTMIRTDKISHESMLNNIGNCVEDLRAGVRLERQ